MEYSSVTVTFITLYLNLFGIRIIKAVLQQTVGREFIYITPVCTDMPTLLIVPQFPGTCRVTVTTPDYQETTVVNDALSVLKSVPCKSPHWTYVGLVGGRIASSCDIMVYLEYNKNDNYLLHPITVSGHVFTINTYQLETHFQTFFAIYATQNNTMVSIELCPELRRKVKLSQLQSYDPNSSSLNISLNENEAFYLKCKCDLSVVVVTSLKNVGVVTGALSYGHKSVNKNMSILIEELSPDSSWGRHFLFPIPPSSNTPFRMKMLGDRLPCEVVIEDDNTNTSTLIVERFPFLLPTFAVQYLRLRTNVSVSLMLVLQISDVEYSHFELFYLPPTSLCLPGIAFYDESDVYGQTTSMYVWGKYGDSLYHDYELLYTLANETRMIGNFYLYSGITKPHYIGIYSTIEGTHIPTICGWVQMRLNNSYTIFSLGMRVTSLFDACTLSDDNSFVDGIDNDCDGNIDEEILNRFDDDGDSLIDEDLGRIDDNEDNSHRFRGKRKSGMTASVLSVIVSITVAVSAVVAFIGGMFVADQVLNVVGGGPRPRQSRVSPIQTEAA